MESSVNPARNLESDPIIRDHHTNFRVEDLGKDRKGLAHGILYGYFVLIAVQIVGPLILLGITWNQPAANTGIVREITDLISGIVPVLSGIVGIAGIAVGYYFKS
jgi:hypothetical protein